MSKELCAEFFFFMERTPGPRPNEIMLRGVTTLTNAVSGQSQNCSGNLEISPGIGTLGNFSGKHAIIPGQCRKKSGHPGMYPQNSGG